MGTTPEQQVVVDAVKKQIAAVKATHPKNMTVAQVAKYLVKQPGFYGVLTAGGLLGAGAGYLDHENRKKVAERAPTILDKVSDRPASYEDYSYTTRKGIFNLPHKEGIIDPRSLERPSVVAQASAIKVADRIRKGDPTVGLLERSAYEHPQKTYWVSNVLPGGLKYKGIAGEAILDRYREKYKDLPANERKIVMDNLRQSAQTSSYAAGGLLPTIGGAGLFNQFTPAGAYQYAQLRMADELEKTANMKTLKRMTDIITRNPDKYKHLIDSADNTVPFQQYAKNVMNFNTKVPNKQIGSDLVSHGNKQYGVDRIIDNSATGRAAKHDYIHGKEGAHKITRKMFNEAYVDKHGHPPSRDMPLDAYDTKNISYQGTKQVENPFYNRVQPMTLNQRVVADSVQPKNTPHMLKNSRNMFDQNVLDDLNGHTRTVGKMLKKESRKLIGAVKALGIEVVDELEKTANADFDNFVNNFDEEATKVLKQVKDTSKTIKSTANDMKVVSGMGSTVAKPTPTPNPKVTLAKALGFGVGVLGTAGYMGYRHMKGKEKTANIKTFKRMANINMNTVKNITNAVVKKPTQPLVKTNLVNLRSQRYQATADALEQYMATLEWVTNQPMPKPVSMKKVAVGVGAVGAVGAGGVLGLLQYRKHKVAERINRKEGLEKTSSMMKQAMAGPTTANPKSGIDVDSLTPGLKRPLSTNTNDNTKSKLGWQEQIAETKAKHAGKVAAPASTNKAPGLLSKAVSGIKAGVLKYPKTAVGLGGVIAGAAAMSAISRNRPTEPQRPMNPYGGQM